MNLSEPFHVTNGARPGGVLHTYSFAIYSDDLSLNQATFKLGVVLVKSYRTAWRSLMTFVCFVQVYVGCKVY